MNFSNCYLFYPTIILVLISNLCYNQLAAQTNGLKNISNKGYFILTLPSTDCINCKAKGKSIIQNIKEININDSIIIVTDNDAGAYYLANNESDFGKFKIVIDELLCSKLILAGQSTISYKLGNSINTVRLSSGIDSLYTLLNFTTNNDSFLHPITTDSIFLNYNIFDAYKSFIFSDSENNLFLFSGQFNAGCFLNPKEKIDTSNIIQTYISTAKYDSLYIEYHCTEFSNIPQKTLREFSKNRGIPISKIFNATYCTNKYYLFYSFFTGKADTIREDSISQKLKYNTCIVRNKNPIVGSPINLSLYETMLNFEDSIMFRNILYQIRTIAEFNVTDSFIYMPISKLSYKNTTIDSLFFLAKFSTNSKKNQSPIEVIHYPSGHFSEECILRTTQGSNPILANKIKNIFDFGEGEKPLKFEDIHLTNLDKDTINFIYDYHPISENDIEIIALTKKSKLFFGHIINKKYVENLKIIRLSEKPFYCQFIQTDKFVTVSKSKNNIITHQYIQTR